MTDLHPILADDRIGAAFERFARHGSDGIALAGGIAMAAQVARLSGKRHDRTFGDIDFVAASLDDLSVSLAAEFICPHVHGTAGPGRTLAQFVHPGDAIRIDIFRSIGQALARAEHFHLGPLSIAVLSIEDQAARATSLCMKVARDGSVVAKHHSDFVRMRGLVSPNRIEAVWKEYRREIEPLRFADAVKEIEAAVEAHPGRLIDAEFNRDPNAICPSCGPWGEFRPADPVETFRILGYA